MKVTYSLNEIAIHIGSECLSCPDLIINDLASINKAQSNDLSFIVSAKYTKQLAISKASAIIVPETMKEALIKHNKYGYSGYILYHNDPYFAYAQVSSLFKPLNTYDQGIHPTAVIASNVVIGDNPSIGAHVVIEEGCTLGDNVIIGANSVIQHNVHIKKESRLYPNVNLGTDCTIGEYCILHSGSVIGADGFGFAQNSQEWIKIEQLGNVIIGDKVEVGANTTIDRGALSSTIIGHGVKLDNQIQIGHNVEVGDHTVMAASVSIAGSTVIGKHVQIGGAVAISGHLTIANHVVITGRTTVLKSITKTGIMVSSGTMADDNRNWRKNTLRFMQLDRFYQRLGTLEKAIQSMIVKK